MHQTPAENRKSRARSPKVEFVLAQPADMKAADVSKKAKEAGLEITPGYVYTIRSSAGMTGKKETRKATPPKAKVGGKKATPAGEVKGTKPAKSAGKAQAPKAKATKKASKSPVTKQAKPTAGKGRGGDKKAFILAQPASMSNAEVIAAAKTAGMSISWKHVRNVREAAGVVVAKTGRAMRKAAVNAPTKKAPAKNPVAKKASAQPKKQTTVRPAQAAPAKPATPEVLFRKLVLELGLTRSRELLVEVERKLAELIAGE